MSDDNDWDFKVDDENVDQVKIASKKASEVKQKRKKKKISTVKDNLKLDEEAKPKRRSMSAIARREAALARHAEFRYPNFLKRGCAVLIDLLVLMAVAGVALMYRSTLNAYYIDFLRDQGMNQTLDPAVVNSLLVFIPVCIAYFIINVLGASYSRKSIGKAIFKIRIGHDEFDRNSTKGQVFIRELFVKPISLLLVIGIFLPLFI